MQPISRNFIFRKNQNFLFQKMENIQRIFRQVDLFHFLSFHFSFIFFHKIIKKLILTVEILTFKNVFL